MHYLNPQILREYDIRGQFGETLCAQDVSAFGHKFAQYLKGLGKQSIVIGRDGRLSSPELMEALIEGLRLGGMAITNVGLGPTPMVSFALKYGKKDACIMITGSHNPAEDNGLKMALYDRALTGKDIRDIGAIDETALPSQPENSTYTEENILETYVARLLQDYHGPSRENSRRLRIGWDPANGAAAEVLKSLIAGIDADHYVIYGDIDGTFPGHHPDPTIPENLTDLQALVREKECDVGIAFDGDGDRIGAVDRYGRILWGDQLTLLLARDVLRDNPGASILADIKSSQVVFEDIQRQGGNAIMTKTGHSLIKAKMKETGALLAGEMSGHIFFADKYYGYDDALYAAVRLLSYLNKEGRPLDALYDELPKTYSTTEIRITCPDTQKFTVIKALQDRLLSEKASVNTTDGVRVQRDDGWWLLRASNTGPLLVGRCESLTEDGLSRLKAEFQDYLKVASI